MTRVSLAEVATIHGGGRLKLSGYDFVEKGTPAYGAGGQNGHVATTEYTRPAVILSSIGARCGKCFYVDGPWTSLANTQVILPDSSQVDPRFLWYQLNDERRWPRSGTGQPFIKPSDVKSHQIELPSLAKQRRVVAILDQADALRAKRREQLALLDSLPQAIFHEMFEAGSRPWPQLPLRRLVSSITTGTSPTCEARAALDSEWGVLKLSSVTTGNFREGENKAYLAAIGAMAANEVRSGDVLMTRKNTRELVGAVAIATSPRPRLLLPDLIFRLELEPSTILASFFQTQMMLPAIRERVRSLAGGSAGSMPNISKGRLMNLVLHVPPVALQQAFEDRLSEVWREKCQIATNLACSDTLFDSLQSRAFRGEL